MRTKDNKDNTYEVIRKRLHHKQSPQYSRVEDFHQD